jgi:hypothetical protein
MTKRVLVAGLLGGLVLFVWEFVAHDVLPLGEAGVRALPNETTVQAALKDNVREPAFYIFPAPDLRPGMSSDQKKQAQDTMMRRMHSEATGVMVVYPQGRDLQFPAALGSQLAGDLMAMMLCALLLAYAPLKGYLARVGFVATIGLIPTLQVDMPQWTWYGFPTDFFAAQFIVHFVGFFLAGLIMARICRPAAA